MSQRAKLLYGTLAALLVAVFLVVFIQSLPGGAHPVIAHQPEIAMASANTGLTLSAQPIEVKVEDGKIKFPLTVLLEKKMVQFDYRGASSTTPLLAYISAEGKLITAVRVCEPCNSKTFRIEGTELCCGNCETRWKLNNLEGLQGSCQKYPPDPVPSTVVGNEVQIDESAVLRWKMRI